MKNSYIIIFSALTMTTILVIAYAIISLKLQREPTRQAKKQLHPWKGSRMLDLDACNRSLGNAWLLQLQDRKHRLEIKEHRRKMVELQEKINVTIAQIHALERNGMSCREVENVDGVNSCGVDPFAQWIADEQKKNGGVVEQLSEDEIIRLSTPQTFIPNEDEALRWDSFTSKHIYRFQEGTSPQPKQKQRQEYTEIILAERDKNSTQPAVTSDDLVDGLSLFSRTRGTLYRLYFRTEIANAYRSTEFFRPFGRIRQLKYQPTVDVSDVWIHVIVPLQGRIDRFRTFVKMYGDVCVKDQKVFLTVVYFGEDGQKEAENILKDMATKNNYKNYKFLASNSNFSRGRGRQYGAEHLDKGNVLMFFCDVDIQFDAGFLERCRIHAQPGKKVYFPIVFSLYNPDVVYGKSQAPPQESRLVIKHETGSWRIYGYGMTCLYRNDFFSVGGFDLSIEGWGGEDVDLAKRFKCSSLQIVRAVDRGIFHLYHEKLCDVGLSKEKYGHCVGSRAIYEASHRQLGLKVLNLTDER